MCHDTPTQKILKCLIPTKKDIVLHNININFQTLTVIYNQSLIHRPHSSFANCPNNVLYGKCTQFRIVYQIQLSCLLIPSDPEQFFGLPLSFITSTLLERIQANYFIGNSLVCIYLHEQIRFCILYRDITELVLLLYLRWYINLSP